MKNLKKRLKNPIVFVALILIIFLDWYIYAGLSWVAEHKAYFNLSPLPMFLFIVIVAFANIVLIMYYIRGKNTYWDLI